MAIAMRIARTAAFTNLRSISRCFSTTQELEWINVDEFQKQQKSKSKLNLAPGENKLAQVLVELRAHAIVLGWLAEFSNNEDEARLEIKNKIDHFNKILPPPWY